MAVPDANCFVIRAGGYISAISRIVASPDPVPVAFKSQADGPHSSTYRRGS